MRFALLMLACLFCSEAYSQYYRPYIVRPYPYYRYEIDENRIYSRWRIQDEYKRRNATENALDRKERMFDQAERAYDLKRREDDLIRKGILPPRKRPEIIFEGRSYSSYAELRESPAYQADIARRKAGKKLEAIIKQQQRDRDNAFLQMWHKMGPIGRAQYGRLSPQEKEMRIDEFLHPQLREYNLEQRRNLKFYESYPHLIPDQGKNGLPSFPFDLLDK